MSLRAHTATLVIVVALASLGFGGIGAGAARTTPPTDATDADPLFRWWFGDGSRMPLPANRSIPDRGSHEHEARDGHGEWFRWWFGDGRRLPVPPEVRRREP
jgi:hypothetical protein